MEISNQEIQEVAHEALEHVIQISEACQNWKKEQKEDFSQKFLSEVIRRHQLSATLTTKSIKHLTFGHSFLVEKYQRGYKWTKVQVNNLLDDIEAFLPEVHGSFYCLQPLVVTYRNDRHCWELIDGQQRLTTIYLILSYLKLQTFELHYLTRKGCTEFLKSLSAVELAANSTWNGFLQSHQNVTDNVDNFHFFQAWQTISAWFASHPGSQQDWTDKLLQHTKVIWFDTLAKDSKESAQIFVRINSGKIALTNAELVKALFLKQSRIGDATYSREEIAREWDRFEQELQNDAFWYFLTGSSRASMPNRIELLFDILAHKPADKVDDIFYTFNHFVGKTDPQLKNEWGKVKDLFLRLKDWFESDEEYHLIGFLVAAGIKRLNELASDGSEYTKTDFLDRLKGFIREYWIKNGIVLKNLRYPTDNRIIQQLLLLFNIEKCRSRNKSSSNDVGSKLGDKQTCPFVSRFPFDLYVKESWSLEHIHAQHSQKLDDNESVQVFRNAIEPLLTRAKAEVYADAAAQSKLTDLDGWIVALDAEKNKRSVKAKELIEKLRSHSFSYFGGDILEAEIDSIDNLALLDKDTNSSLNNAIFPEKRKMIRDYDLEGRFIPAGTKDVFMKYHSDDFSQMSVWSPSDRSAYLSAIRTTLQHYLPGANT